MLSRKETKHCQKLTRLNKITYASKNLFTLCSSCDVAVTWQAKQRSVNVLLHSIAASLWMSAMFLIHEIDGILKTSSWKSSDVVLLSLMLTNVCGFCSLSLTVWLLPILPDTCRLLLNARCCNVHVVVDTRLGSFSIALYCCKMCFCHEWNNCRLQQASCFRKNFQTTS